MPRPPKVCTGLIIDTETTGLQGNDEIIEIAMVLFRYEVASGNVVEISEAYSGLREPNVPIGKTAQRVNGITHEMVKGKMLDHNKMAALLSSAERIYAHNAPFDYRFVAKLLPESSDKYWVCTMNGIRWLDEGAPNKKLGDLVTHFNVDCQATHRALDDAMALLSLIRMTGSSGKPHIVKLHKKSAYRPTEHKTFNDNFSPALQRQATGANGWAIGNMLGRLVSKLIK